MDSYHTDVIDGARLSLRVLVRVYECRSVRFGSWSGEVTHVFTFEDVQTSGIVSRPFFCFPASRCFLAIWRYLPYPFRRASSIEFQICALGQLVSSRNGSKVVANVWF